MKLNLSVDEVLATTRAVRKRLDFEKPVEPEIIKECLEAAIQSPTGSNSQSWQWLVVTDPEQRAALAELYKQGWELYTQMEGNVETAYKGADEERISQQTRVLDSATYLAQNFEKVPVMMIPILPDALRVSRQWPLPPCLDLFFRSLELHASCPRTWLRHSLDNNPFNV